LDSTRRVALGRRYDWHHCRVNLSGTMSKSIHDDLISSDALSMGKT